MADVILAGPGGLHQRMVDDGTGTYAPEVVVVGASATGGLTDTELRATPVPVSGDFSSDGLTDTQLRATAVPVSLAELPDITTVPLYATLHAVVAVAAGATGAIVAADATHKIRVVQYTVIGHGAGSFQWKSAATAKSGAMDYVVASGAAPYCPEGLIETAVNEALNLTTVTGAANGHISYQLI